MKRTVIAQVSAQIQAAIQAARADDIDGLIRYLDRAVSAYEANPSQVQEPTSRLPALLTLICSTERLCESLGRPCVNVRAVKQRA